MGNNLVSDGTIGTTFCSTQPKNEISTHSTYCGCMIVDILGISLGYLWDIFGISLGYIWDIFGISLGYLGDTLGIFLGYL